MPSFKAIASLAPQISRYVQTAAAGTAPSAFVFVNPTGSGSYYEVVEVRAIWEANGGAAAAAFVGIGPATTAIASLTTTQAANFDLTTGARTAVVKNGGNLTATVANRLVKPGDAVGVVTSGTLTALTGLVVEVVLKPIRVKETY